MKRTDEEQRLVRRYLLGSLSSEEQEQLEERFMTDSEYKEEVLVIEDELIEDYLANALSDEEREKFVKHFLSTPQQIQKVEIAKALNQYFSVEEAAHSPPSVVEPRPPDSAKPWLAALLRLRESPAALSLLAALALIIFVGSWLLIGRRPRPAEPVSEQSQNQQFQSELARLNGSSTGNGQTFDPGAPKAKVLTLPLPPLTLRGGGESPVARLAAGTEIVELLLVLPAGETSGYRATLQKSGEAARFVVDNLAARTTASGQAVPLKIPARYLSRGDYLVELSATNAEGRFNTVGGYSFRVLK